MQPTLIILAAGMGSRYGGLKQIDTVGDNGEVLMDFTVYDAIEAGFKKIIFIIRKEHEALFEANIARKVRKKAQVVYAYQDLNDLPQGLEVPKERIKPWGTTHALLACRNLIADDPFVVCNADDYYGKDAFKQVFAFLNDSQEADEYCVCGYHLFNTLSDHGTVTRGFCTLKDGYLQSVHDVMKIKKSEDGKGAEYWNGEGYTACDPKMIVSMNFWGFKASIMPKLAATFKAEITQSLKKDPLKYEALLPNHVGMLIEQGKCRVKVLTSNDSWFGVTYKEDKAKVTAAIKTLKSRGAYPEDLWK